MSTIEGILPIAATIVALVLLVAIVLFVVRSKKASSNSSESQSHKKNATILTDAENMEKQYDENVAYLKEKLFKKPNDISHKDLLFYIVTTPQMLKVAKGVLDRVDEIKEERLADKTKDADHTSLLDGDGWADDDDTDDAHDKAIKEDAARAAAAAGKAAKHEVKLEGLDEGVIGADWVRSALTNTGSWPPVIDALTQANKELDGSLKDKDGVAFQHMLDIPEVLLNMTMLFGRLNANLLNTNPKLIESASEGKVDSVYFSETQTFRKNSGILLEACLRMAAHSKETKLCRTIIETVSIFKLGIPSVQDIQKHVWFREVMKKTYGGPSGIPALDFKEKNIKKASSSNDEEESTMYAGDELEIVLDVERLHCNNFVQAKLAMAKAQGLDPQVACASYREVWWVLISAKKKKGDDNDNGDDKQMTREEEFLHIFPFMVTNLTQRSGKLDPKFNAPAEPGSYTISVEIKSQDFIGCDAKVEFEVELVAKKEGSASGVVDVEESKKNK